MTKNLYLISLKRKKKINLPKLFFHSFNNHQLGSLVEMKLFIFRVRCKNRLSGHAVFP